VYGLETTSHGSLHLANGEVALRTYQHQGVLLVGRLAKLVEQIGSWHLLIAMGNIFSA
jgi:hypothetical protein